jgi:hypothetical protein
MVRPLDQLMQKEMTRKEFLLTLALSLASIFGIGRIIELFTGHSLSNNTNSHLGAQTSSYSGSSAKAGL